MNIDERIKKELETEVNELDRYFASDMLDEQKYIPKLLYRFLNFGVGFITRWNWAVGTVTGVLCLVSAFKFMRATEIFDLKLWGLIFMFSLVGSAITKLQGWTDMGRRSILRELKWMEYRNEKQ